MNDFHPLLGIDPFFACGEDALKALQIGPSPPYVNSVPRGEISADVAALLLAYWKTCISRDSMVFPGDDDGPPDPDDGERLKKAA